MRLKEKMKTLKEKIDTQTRETGIAQATALLAPRSRQEWELHVPEMEWCVFYLPSISYRKDFLGGIRSLPKMISSLII